MREIIRTRKRAASCALATIAVVTSAIVLVAGPALSFAGAAPNRAVIKAAGKLSFSPNHFFKDGQHYTPGVSIVSSGGKLIIKNTTKEDHTFSLVRRSQVPKTLAQGNACYGPKGACNKTLEAHGFNDNDPSNDKRQVNAGKPGFDRGGDSVLLQRGKTVTEDVSAPQGRDLYFICVFHPQMQGKIQVR
jgi:hypothetical protein